MADKCEQFIMSYLRLNGYFTVPNFVVHAAADPNRCWGGLIGNFTETDILAIRMPYSKEQTGGLCIANHPPLVEGSEGLFDVVIGEVKSGENNKPNSIWRQTEDMRGIEYLVRFIGLHSAGAEVSKVASDLVKCYSLQNNGRRFRYIVFSWEPNKHYVGLGVQYITFSEIVKFLVEVRGQCWIDSELGVASIHQQWDSVLNSIFEIANDTGLDLKQRQDRMLAFLREP